MNIISKSLDNDFLDKIVLKEKPYFIKFTNYPGLRLKVNPKGRISYVTYGRIRFGGNPRTVTHGTINKISIHEALEMHYQSIRLLSKGLDPNLIKKNKNIQFSNTLIFKDIAIQFINEKKNNKEYSVLYFNHCKDYLLEKKLKIFHDLNIISISKDDINQWYQSLSSIPSTANSAMTFLTKVFSYAVTKNYIDFQSNPVNSINRYQLIQSIKNNNIQMDLNNELPKFLYQLWDPLNAHNVNLITKYAIYMMLITGMKKNDILTMKWSQVTTKKYIKIEKKSFTQLYPINNHVDDILYQMSLLRKKSLIQNDDQYIFYNINSPKKPLLNIRKTLSKYSIDLEWVVFPEAIRKTFTKLINESAIPTHHYYYLLGLNNKTSSFNSLANYSISTIELSKSLDVVHKRLESLSPMTIPGIDEPLRYFITRKM